MKYKNVDLWIYVILVVLLVFYAFQIKLTCEELGCLAVVVPIIGIMILTGIEFVINLILLIRHYNFNVFRWTIFSITAAFSIAVLSAYIIGLIV